MSAFRDTIDKHLSEGTCYLCGKAVVEFEAVHGLTGAHWACHETEESKWQDAIKRVDVNIAQSFEALEQLRRRR